MAALRDPAVRARFARIVEHYRARVAACTAEGDAEGATVAALVAMHLSLHLTDRPADVERYALDVRDCTALCTSHVARRKGAA